MGKFLPFILLLVLLASSSLAAPKDEEGEAVAAAVSAPEKKVASTEREVTTMDDTWATFFNENGKSLGIGLLGIIVALGGIGLFGYYGLNVYGANAVDTGYTGNANYQGQPNYYSSYGYQPAAGRAISNTGNWNFNWAKVLDYIDIAQKTYEGFDWQNLDCQKRVLCEIAQERSPAGETGRKITNSYLLSVAEAVEGMPMPKIIQAYLSQYKEAIIQGKSKKVCGEVYSKCKFSISKLVSDMKIKNKDE